MENSYIKNNNILVNVNYELYNKLNNSNLLSNLGKYFYTKTTSNDPTSEYNYYKNIFYNNITYSELLPKISKNNIRNCSNPNTYININFADTSDELKSNKLDYLWENTKEYNISNINNLYEFKKYSDNLCLRRFKETFSKLDLIHLKSWIH